MKPIVIPSERKYRHKRNKLYPKLLRLSLRLAGFLDKPTTGQVLWRMMIAIGLIAFAAR